MKNQQRKINYSELLQEALKLEGKLSDCYSAFHDYSFMNQILAWAQLDGAEPINTYKGWQELGRQVRKGEKAIELCMPVIYKNKEAEGDEDDVRVGFMFRRYWFGLSQTDGQEYQPKNQPKGFNKDLVLTNLIIPELDFEMVDGNVQGYANSSGIAINPLAKYPLKTLWHELAHKLLGHVKDAFAPTDNDRLPRNIGEVEAECVAYLLCNIFDYEEPKAESRGYIQDWLAKDEMPPESAKRIFKSVNEILKANKQKQSA